MKRLLATLALAVGSSGLMGCSYGPVPGSDYTVYLDPAMSPAQTESVLHALDVWVAATADQAHPATLHPVMLDVTCGQECHNVITVHAVATSVMQAMENSEEDIAGLCQHHWHHDWINGAWDYSNIYLASDVDPNQYDRVAMHEVGHALSLSHTGTGTVMCAHVWCESETVTLADVEQYSLLR